MRRLFGKEFAFAHVLLAALVLVVTCMPNQRMVTVSYYPLLAGLAVIEVLYLLRLAALRRRGAFSTGPTDIVVLVWALFIVWDVCATKLDIAPTVIVPAPEAVFNVFFAQADVIGADIVSSVTLLVMGYAGGLALGVVLGIVCGWIPRLRAMFFPIANVLAPIPPTVFAPYLIVLLPTFRTASCFIILLGVFWPQFLNMVVRTSSLDAQLLDNARTLGVRNFTMITRIILPYVLPEVLKGLRVSLTTAFLMLTFAEMLGASTGIGYFISNANNYANYTNVVAGIIVCGVVVTVLSFATAWVQRRFTTWREEAGRRRRRVRRRRGKAARRGAFPARGGPSGQSRAGRTATGPRGRASRCRSRSRAPGRRTGRASSRWRCRGATCRARPT